MASGKLMARTDVESGAELDMGSAGLERANITITENAKKATRARARDISQARKADLVPSIEPENQHESGKPAREWNWINPMANCIYPISSTPVGRVHQLSSRMTSMAHQLDELGIFIAKYALACSSA
jgi:hypothetical protein